MPRRRGHGEGSIYQRSDGRWVGSITIAGGKRKDYYGKTRREVQDKLKTALYEQQRGLLANGPSQTVRQFLDRWLEDNVKTSVRPSTFASYTLNVGRVTPHIGHLRLHSLSPADVQACYGELLKSGLSHRSVEQAHAVLHCACRQAVLWGLAARNPTEAVSVPRPERREMNTLNREQVCKLLTSSKDDELHALWVLLVTTGLRLGEATGLRWDDVDFGIGRLKVQRALQWQKGKGLVMVEPKTERSRRTVHLAPGTVTALRQHQLLQEANRLTVGALWKDTGLVFCSLEGKPLDPARVNEAFHKALDNAGLPRIRVHDLRHTAATLLLSQGTHPKVVQELLGHSTITLTLDTYSHVIPALHEQAAQAMDTLFREPAKKS